MNERRKGDRRRYDHRPAFPLVDSDGNTVTQNRRRVVDRRYHDAPVDEVAAQEADLNEAHAVDETPATSRLVLSLDDREILLDASVSDFVVGRHSESDLRANSKTVSRHHLKISWSDDGFVVTDQSSNGTYIQAPDGRVHHLHGESLALNGEGTMFLGLPPEDPTAVRLAFNVS